MWGFEQDLADKAHEAGIGGVGYLAHLHNADGVLFKMILLPRFLYILQNFLHPISHQLFSDFQLMVRTFFFSLCTPHSPLIFPLAAGTRSPPLLLGLPFPSP